MTAIKICGLTRTEDALAAARAGADFLGFIFIEDSPRFMDANAVRAIRDAVRESGASTRFVGVFRNAPAEVVRKTIDVAGLDVAQLHGDEDDRYAVSIPADLIRTVRVGEAVPSTDGRAIGKWLLFDTMDARLSGGTGRRFDWSLIEGVDRSRPIFLAGGLTPENVALAVRVVRPDGVDVASGVEDSPGVKNRDAIARFIDAVREEDRHDQR